MIRFLHDEPNDAGDFAIRNAGGVAINLVRDADDGSIRIVYTIAGELNAEDFPPGVDPLQFCRDLLGAVKPKEVGP